LLGKAKVFFFRKRDFNAELNFRSRQIVNAYEEEKIKFSTLIKLSDFSIRRNIPIYKLSDDPKGVSFEVRNKLYPDFKSKVRDFLESFIAKLAENDVLVFEFIEYAKQKEKVNIDGFYLSPNVIVLKRNQKSLTREIFTLAHELGHYVLNKEEIDTNVEQSVQFNPRIDRVETWCNNFAYHFLAGEFDKQITAIKIADDKNDYLLKEVEAISRKTHLSMLSIYTKLLLNEKISPFHYSQVKDYLFDKIEKAEAEKKRILELKKQQAIAEGKEFRMGSAKPIISPLYFQTMRSALDYGLINEVEFCNRLKINPLKLEQVINNANY
jgi:Zn-dependent peptidase ImmA (M78 family)